MCALDISSNIVQKTSARLEAKPGIFLSQGLQYSIKLLGMDQDDLDSVLDEESAQNPLLTLQKLSTPPPATQAPAQAATQAPAQDISRVAQRAQSQLGGNDSWVDYTSDSPTLYQHLSDQIYFLQDAQERKIAQMLIGHLDKNGYFMEHQYLDFTGRKSLNKQEKQVLRLVQKAFSPLGVCARDLKERMKIQLEDKGMWNKNIEKILQLLESGKKESDLPLILGIAKNKLNLYMGYLKTCNPFPLDGFDHNEKEISVVPDLLLDYNQDGSGIAISLNNRKKIYIDTRKIDLWKQYKTNALHNMGGTAAPPATKANPANKAGDMNPTMPNAANGYGDYLKKANTLIYGVKKRGETLLKVANSIFTRQKQFFLDGTIMPLQIKEIAQELNLHESTVSRATSRKYIQTPMGTFELNYFFSSSIDGVSSCQYIKKKIANMIKFEDNSKPLSDQDISRKLIYSDGIDLARRTVAKYRSILKIPPSHKRRA